jgi:hypothetical protein
VFEGWIELGRLPVVGNCTVLVASFETRITTIVIGRCIVRIEFYRHVVVGDGTLAILEILPGVAAIVVGNGIVRLEAERLGMIRDRLIEQLRGFHRCRRAN